MKYKPKVIRLFFEPSSAVVGVTIGELGVVGVALAVAVFIGVAEV